MHVYLSKIWNFTKLAQSKLKLNCNIKHTKKNLKFKRLYKNIKIYQ